VKNLDHGKISSSQFMWLLVTLVIPTAVLFVSAIMIKQAGTMAWVSGIFVATGWALLVVWVAVTLGERFGGCSPVEFTREILGKPLGNMVNFLYILIFLYVNSIIVREFGELLITAYMPETPLLVFNTVLLLLAASAVRNGIEVIARMSQFIVVLMFAGLIFIYIFLWPEIYLHNLFPLFEGGLKPIILGSFISMAWRGEIFLLLFLMPYLQDYREAKPAAYKAVFVLGVILGIDIIILLAVFGIQAANMVFPLYVLGTYISVGGFLERVESFTLAIWVTGVFAKVTIWYYFGVIVTAQTFNLKQYKPLVLPLGVIQVVWSVIAYDNVRQLADFFSKAWITFSMSFEFLLPLTLLIIALIRTKGRQSNEI
jgi:spore germination protein KB